MGSVPPSGVVIEVLVYYQGTWQPNRTPRTDGRWRVRVAYRFHRVWLIPVSLRAQWDQARFPYGDGSVSQYGPGGHLRLRTVHHNGVGTLY